MQSFKRFLSALIVSAVAAGMLAYSMPAIAADGEEGQEDPPSQTEQQEQQEDTQEPAEDDSSQQEEQPTEEEEENSESSSTVDNDKLDSLQDKYNSLDQQLKDVANRIEALGQDKSKRLELQKQIQLQISLTQQQINLLNQKITETEQSIQEKEQQIKDKEAEIEENDDLLCQRLRAMQVSGTGSSFDVLFGSGSFSELLSHAVTVSRVAAHDKDLLTDLANEKQQIEDTKASIEQDKKSLEESKLEVDQKKVELDRQSAQNQQLINEIQEDESALSSEQEALKKELAAVEAEITAIIQQNSGDGEYVGGEFMWPLPGYSQITSYFGGREIEGAQDNHTGIDISGSGVYGSDIVAANSGTVIAVRNYTTGYGKHLIIDHGGGRTTVYAHTSEILVSEGQQVVQGQTIARVGSTGWSTGPHLHFEIRINGKAVNPLSYL